MKISRISDQYSVTPQIACEDIAAIVQAGFKTVVCNRPDAEVPPSHQAEAIQAAAHAAGLTFHFLPLTHHTMNAENIAQQMAFIHDDAPVLAYCASGTRCTVIWALGTASESHDIDAILNTAHRAGYPLEGLRPTLNTIANSES